MSYVPIDEVIATAQSAMKGVTSNDKLIFRQWVCLLALPELGTAASDVKVITLYPTEGSAPLPDDLKMIIDFSLFDSNGCQLRHKYRNGGQRIYTDTRVPLVAYVGPTNSIPLNNVPVDVSTDSYSVNLGTNGDQVASIVLRYFTYPTSADGLPLVSQEDTMAVISFLRYMWSARENNNQSEIQMNEQRWLRESDKCKARKKMWSVSNDAMKQITSNWMRQIPSFNFSQY